MLTLATVLLILSQVRGQFTYNPTESTCAGTKEDPCGPVYWGNVPGSVCDDSAQTPIDISQAVVNTNGDKVNFISRSTGCKSWNQAANSYGYQISFTEDGEALCNDFSVSFRGEVYDFLQMHFHIPSEHSIGGGFFGGEGHMVHYNSETGLYLVLGIFIDPTSDSIPSANGRNPFFALLRENGDVASGESVTVTDAANVLNPYTSFLPGSPAFYNYYGSFTTPPCSEIVQWIVFQEPIKMSLVDFELLKSAIGAAADTQVASDGSNNRPIQPQNGRVVELFPGDGFDENSGDDNDAMVMSSLILSVISTFMVVCLTIAVIMVLIELRSIRENSNKNVQSTNSKAVYKEVPSDSKETSVEVEVVDGNEQI